MKILPHSVVLVLLMVAKVNAQQFQGADAALKRLAEAAAKPLETKEADPGAELFFRFKAFQKDSAAMPPERAAAQWLALYDTFIATPHTVLRGYSRTSEHWVTSREVFSSLPPPAAWPFLADALKSRKREENVMRSSAEHVLGSVLANDKPGLKQEAVHLQKEMQKSEPSDRWRFEEAIEMLESITADPLSAAEYVAADMEEKIAYVEKGSQDKEFDMPGEARFDVPDLVAVLGEPRATQLLGRILPLAYDLRIEARATKRLTAKLALTHVDRLRVPFWEFIESLEDIPLYEAFVKRFGNVDGYYRVEADTVYLVHLIAEGRTREAVKFAGELAKRERIDEFSLTGHDLESMRQQGLSKQVLVFLQEMLGGDPSLPFWNSYINLSANEGASRDALAFLRTVLAKPDVPVPAKEEMQKLYYQNLLAADEVEEGVKALRELINLGPKLVAVKGAGAAEPPQDPFQIDDALEDHMKLSLKLVEIGTLLQRKDWIDEGFAAARGSYARLTMSGRFGHANTLAFYLVEVGRFADAEAIVVARLEELLRPDPTRDRSNDHREQVECLAALANIYLAAGQPQDVILLLDRSPHWRAPDLGSLPSVRGARKELQLIAAQAFVQVGRNEEAAKLALRVLSHDPQADSAYEVLLKSGAKNLKNLMDELSRHNRFEARPLIWKAKLQLDDGTLDEAEKTIRGAIALDPSGNTEKGELLSAYDILGQILEKKGDAAQAKMMRDVVASIQLYENADDWLSAGLSARAVAMYEKAQNLFADTYGIQIRLAQRYAAGGDLGKSEDHYRRAFELMPGSLGQVRRNWIVWEDAFYGSRTQSIAERVFTSVVEKEPGSAHVFYLLGELRAGQERNTEAVECYWRATKLDPDYLNAWIRLSELDSKMGMSEKQYEEIDLALIRLDPASRDFSASSAIDLGKFWTALLAAERSLPEEETGPVYPLAASAPEFERLSAESAQNIANPQHREGLRMKLLEHPSIALVVKMLEFAQ